jgi:hypothetical protein
MNSDTGDTETTLIIGQELAQRVQEAFNNARHYDLPGDFDIQSLVYTLRYIANSPDMIGPNKFIYSDSLASLYAYMRAVREIPSTMEDMETIPSKSLIACMEEFMDPGSKSRDLKWYEFPRTGGLRGVLRAFKRHSELGPIPEYADPKYIHMFAISNSQYIEECIIMCRLLEKKEQILPSSPPLSERIKSVLDIALTTEHIDDNSLSGIPPEYRDSIIHLLNKKLEYVSRYR